MRQVKNILSNKFFKNSILYTVGAMLTPLVGLIMLPIYTNYLSPSEYGVMTTVQTLVGMLQLFLLLSLHGAVTRFYYDFLDNPQKQKEYLGSIYIFTLIFSLVLSVILILFKESIGSLLFQNIPVDPYYYYLIGIAWVSALSTLPMALFRAQEKAGLFVIINLIKAVSIMSLSAYLIIVKGLGAESALIAHLIVTFVIVIITFLMQRKSLTWSLNISFVKQSLIFSIPLLPHVASGWIISSSDRVILEKFVSLDEIGLYALAVQVSLVLSLFYTSVNNALVPRYTRLRKENKDIEGDKLLKIFSRIIIIFGSISIPVAMIAIYLFTSNEFQGALIFIPFLLIGQIIRGFYFIPVAKLFYVKKTKSIATSSTIAAIVSILINITLIPFIGIYGAVITAILTEIIRYVLIRKASLSVNKPSLS
ncbi:lipopolysaccharide biosynthesis protein [Jeotgalibacillus malaysiensis]|uniref:lipopolysaccharide biosynthesis protein n=1 Tax=Jeotgalibacillus malaysiensis TaxID=1508404 RepID=UPI0038500BF2